MIAALALTTTAIGLGAIVAVTRLRRGPMIAPFTTTMVVLVSIFGIRPLFEVRAGQHEFHGHDVSAGAAGAAIIGLLAVVWCTVGYVVADRTRPAPAEPSGGDGVLDLRLAATVGAVMIGLWAAAIAHAGGGLHFVAELFRGRNAATRAATAGLPEAVFALTPAAAVLVSAQRIRIERVRRLTRIEHVAFAAVVLGSFLPPLALGSRRYLLPGLIAAIAALLAPTWRRRITLRGTVVAAGLALLLVSIPYARSTGSSAAGKGTLGGLSAYLGSAGVGGAVERYFLSYDTEMFGYTAYLYEHIGDDLALGWGRWLVVDPLLAPLPRPVADATGLSGRDEIVMTHMIGHGCDTLAGCPVGSIVGISYAEFGLIGVSLLLALWGALTARMQRALLAARGARLATVVTFVGFTPVLVRGNTVNQLWIFANALVLVVLADRWCSRRAGVPRPVRRERRSAFDFDVSPSTARRRVFVSVAAQHENLGDLVIRREAVRWAAASGAWLDVYVGGMPATYLEALDLPPQARCTRSALVFEARLWRSALAGRAAMVMAPGPQSLELSAGTLAHQLMGVVHAALLRVRRCPYVKPGRSYRTGNRLLLALERIEHRLATRSWVRDVHSPNVLHLDVDVLPDMAFAAGACGDTGVVHHRAASPRPASRPRAERPLLAISPRRREQWPDHVVEAVRHTATRTGLELVVVTQVQLDEPFHRELAERFAIRHVEWGSRSHAEQLERVLDTYGKSAVVVSDRLHALVFAMCRGAAVRQPGDIGDRKIAPALAAVGQRVPVFDTSIDRRRLSSERSRIKRRAATAAQLLATERGRVVEMLRPRPGRSSTIDGDVETRRRVPWMVVSQFLSAITNALVVVVAARRLDDVSLGRVGLIVTGVVLVITAVRPITAKPLLVHEAAGSGRPAPLHHAMRVSVWVGLALALLVAASTPAWGDPVLALALATGAVPLLVQDQLRYSALAVRRPAIAAMSDGVWLAVFALVAVARPADGPRGLLVAWLAGATVAAAAAALALGSRRWRSLEDGSLAGTLAWLRDTWPMSRALLADIVVVTVYGNATPFVVAIVSNTSESGSYRLALTIVGIVTVAITGVAAQGLADMARLVGLGLRVDGVRRRLSRRLVVLAVAVIAGLSVTPNRVGRIVFGDAWADAHVVAWWLSVAMIGTSIVAPALSSLQAHGANAAVLRLRSQLAPMHLAFVVVGAAIAGAAGAAVGLLAGNVLSVTPWLRLTRRVETLARTADPSAGTPRSTDRSGAPLAAAGGTPRG